MSRHRLTRCVAVMGVALAMLGGGRSGGANAASPRQAEDTIVYYPPHLVQAPQVLTTDPGSGRCPDASQPCFKDNKDLLNGRRHVLRDDDIIITGEFSAVPLPGFPPPPVASTYASAVIPTSNSTISTATGSAFISGDYSQPTVIGARLFNLDHDAVVTATFVAHSGDLQLEVLVPSRGGFAIKGASSSSVTLLAAAADVTGDGFADVIYTKGNVLQVVTAADPNNPDLDPPLKAGPEVRVDSPSVMVVGNFSGSAYQIATLTIRPQALMLELFSIDPKTLQISLAGTLPLQLAPGDSPSFDTLAMASGRFSNALHDQLVITYTTSSDTGSILTVDFDSNGEPVQKAIDATLGGKGVTALVRAGHFDWSSPFDVVALMVTSNPSSSGIGDGYVEILGFDANLNPVNKGPAVKLLGGQCIYDMQVGNFDRQQPDPNQQGSTIRNPDLQLALVSASGCRMPGLTVSIWNVAKDPTSGNFTLTPDVSVLQLPTFEPQFPIPLSLSLAAADTQGRSLALGAPTIVTIEHRAQPTVVVAAPPMHVDVVNGKLVNFTAAPGGFYTTYQTSDNSSTEGSTTHTTTWSFSAEEKLEAKFTEGDCDVGDCVSGSNEFSAKQALDGSTAALHGTFSSSSLNISQNTGFSDVLWYTDSTLTVYIYPVIGKTVCPAAKPDCADNDKVPMTMQFAGPDTISPTSVDAIHVPWYQPPWMPGNLLSYPGTLGQLQAATFADPSTFQQLTNPIRWFTDASDATATASWTTGQKDGSTTSFNQNYSFNDTVSFSSTWGLGKVSTVEATASLSLSGSVGFSNLADALTTLSKSTGIGFTKKATFADPNLYGYYVTPYIYGQKTPGGVVADQALSTDVQTFGMLLSGHVVDPLADGAGAVWRQLYTLPDVGLNQPGRWQVETSSTDPHDGTCLIFDNASSDVDCATLSVSAPSDPWTDEFHWMRGLFITGAEANGAGPQLGSATAGDQLLLQARVHNFSFAPMPDGTEVHVRFYGMPWDTGISRPAAASFFIGEAKIGAIPPFNTTTDQPNWLLVSQTFDTTPHPDTDLVLWVVVWMQDAHGTLVPEMPSRGLQRIPDVMTDFACAPSGHCPTGVEESHSNNVGFYNQVFHIFPKSMLPAVPVPAGGEVGVQIVQIGAEKYKGERGERTLVGVKLRTGSQHLTSGLTVHFYDGDPRQGGKAFAVHHLPFLRGNATYDYRAPFRADGCGPHAIYVVAGQDTRHEQIARLTRPIIVFCH